VLKIYNQEIDGQTYRVPVHTLADGTTVVITYHGPYGRRFSDGTKLHISLERNIKIADSHWVSQLDIIEEWTKFFEVKEKMYPVPEDWNIPLPGNNQIVNVCPYLTPKQYTVLSALCGTYGIVMVQPKVILALQQFSEETTKTLQECEDMPEFNIDAFNTVLTPTSYTDPKNGVKTVDLKKWRFSLINTSPYDENMD